MQAVNFKCNRPMKYSFLEHVQMIKQFFCLETMLGQSVSPNRYLINSGERDIKDVIQKKISDKWLVACFQKIK